MSISVSGIENLELKFNKLTDAKASTQIKIMLARAAKPIRKAAKNEAPKAKRYTTNQTGVVAVGTLKKSMSIFKGKSKTYPNVQVGAKQAKRGGKIKNDGFFAHFVSGGTVNGIKPNKFMHRAKDMTENQAVTGFETEYAKRLNQLFK